MHLDYGTNPPREQRWYRLTTSRQLRMVRPAVLGQMQALSANLGYHAHGRKRQKGMTRSWDTIGAVVGAVHCLRCVKWELTRVWILHQYPAKRIVAKLEIPWIVDATISTHTCNIHLPTTRTSLTRNLLQQFRKDESAAIHSAQRAGAPQIASSWSVPRWSLHIFLPLLPF